MYAMIFVLSIAAFNTTSIANAVVCGTITKYNAGGFLSETGDRWGNEAVLTVNSASVCGTDTSTSFAHITTGGLTSGTSSGSDFIESGMWKGYQGTASTGTGIKYHLIKQNYYENPGAHQFYDLSANLGVTPLVGDNVKITLNWDHYTNFRDYYKLTIYNPARHATQIVNDIWVDGRGTTKTTQTEKLNQNSVIKATGTSIRDYDTTLAWSDWTSSFGAINPTTIDNTMCYIKNAANSYSFGELSGGTCLTS